MLPLSAVTVHDDKIHATLMASTRQVTSQENWQHQVHLKDALVCHEKLEAVDAHTCQRLHIPLHLQMRSITYNRLHRCAIKVTSTMHVWILHEEHAEASVTEVAACFHPKPVSLTWVSQDVMAMWKP